LNEITKRFAARPEWSSFCRFGVLQWHKKAGTEGGLAAQKRKKPLRKEVAYY